MAELDARNHLTGHRNRCNLNDFGPGYSAEEYFSERWIVAEGGIQPGESSLELPEKLDDCAVHWPVAGSELIIAEGDSAADALTAIRNDEWQAVLPMQGKPMNVLTASDTRIDANEQFRALRAAIGDTGPEPFRLNNRRYQRIVLAFDPDADGIHSRALLLFFIDRFLGPLLDAGEVFAARPPLWKFESSKLAEPLYAWTDPQHDDVAAQLDARGITGRDEQRFRGLASMPAETLRATCVDPTTRVLARLTRENVEAARGAYQQARSSLQARPIAP